MIEFKWLHEPKFAMGQTVWVADPIPGRDAVVWQDRIIRQWVELFQEDLRHRFPEDTADQVYGFLRGYVLGLHNLEDPNNLWPENVLFATQEEAQLWGRFVPVTLSDEEWSAALGLENQWDGGELKKCCAQICSIRDMLFDCRKSMGMVAGVVKRFQGALDAHEVGTNDMPNLKKIFAQLGVEWKGL